MKNRICALLFAILLLLSLAACGGDNNTSSRDDSDATAAPTQSATAVADDTQAATVSDDTPDESDANTKAIDTGTDGNTQKYATLEDYMNAPENSEGMEELKESADSVMQMDVRVEDSTLVYDYTYNETIAESDLPAVKSNLNGVIDASSASFENLADIMQEQIEESITVKIIYRNSDGEILAEREFDP